MALTNHSELCLSASGMLKKLRTLCDKKDSFREEDEETEIASPQVSVSLFCL